MDVIAIHCLHSNTKYLTHTGINECDCRTVSLLAMTKRKKATCHNKFVVRYAHCDAVS